MEERVKAYQSIYFDKLQDILILYLHYTGEKSDILKTYIDRKIKNKLALGILEDIIFLDLYEAIKNAGEFHNIVLAQEKIQILLETIFKNNNKQKIEKLKNQLVVLTSKFRIPNSE